MLGILSDESARYAAKFVGRNPFGYTVGGTWYTSCAQQGCPLPSKQTARESLGFGELLLPATWSLLKDDSVRFANTAGKWHQIGSDDVAGLELGLAYYNYKYSGKNDYTPPTCRWVPWDDLPDTPEQYFDEFVGRRPTAEDPNPELELVEGMDFGQGAKGDGPSASGSRFGAEGLPPGNLAGWYYAVRIVLRQGNSLTKIVGSAEILICMYQIAVPSGEGLHDAWLMNATKLVFRHELTELVRRLERMVLERFGGTVETTVVEQGSEEQPAAPGGASSSSGGPSASSSAGRGRGRGRGGATPSSKM